MNRYACCMLAVTAGALMMQGCAQTESVRDDMPTMATATTTNAAPLAAASGKAAVAIPEDAKGKPIVAADNKEDFDAIAAAIRKEMQPGGRFGFVAPSGRATVNSGLSDMATEFDLYGSVGKMDPAAKARLLADQNSINEVLARYDSDRRICWQETPVGTHFPRTVCRTLGEIQREKENGQHFMNQSSQLQRQMQEAHAVQAGGGH